MIILAGLVLLYGAISYFILSLPESYEPNDACKTGSGAHNQ